MKTLILGAGPCGLGAAHHLQKIGNSDWQLFERHDVNDNRSHLYGFAAAS